MLGRQQGPQKGPAATTSRQKKKLSPEQRIAEVQTGSSSRPLDLTGRPPVPPDQDTQMDHDQRAEDSGDSDPGPVWQRNQTSAIATITKTDRVSRPRLLLTLRPLTKISIKDIPKGSFAHLIGITAPQTYLSEIASHKYDVAGNCIHITVYDKEHAQRIVQTTSIQSRHNGKTIAIPVEVKESYHRPNTTRGVIEVEPNESNEDILRWLRCEQAKVLSAQRIGKTNRAVVTFDSPTLPKVVKYYMAIVKVTAYSPKRMVCYNCHQIGHMAKHCPHPSVCRTCGRDHDGDQECAPTVYCAACKDVGHIAVSPKCPSRIPTPTNTPGNDAARGISWAHRVAQSNGNTASDRELPVDSKRDHQSSSLTESVSAEILAQLASLRNELQQLRKENQELKKALAEKTKPPPPAQPQSTPPKTSSRRSRSPTFKRTPTSQSRIDPELKELLNIIRSDVQKERAARQEDISKIRSLLESHETKTTKLIQTMTSQLPQQDPKEEPPRKIPQRTSSQSQ